MIRNIVILTCNDLAISLKNKTLYLILFIPLFVFVALQLVDDTALNVQKIKIGLLEQGEYPPAMIQSLQSAVQLVEISWLSSQEEGMQWLKGGQVDGPCK